MRLPTVDPPYTPASGPSFAEVLDHHGAVPPARTGLRTLQINVGKRCNQACLHCHVEAGPHRSEQMSRGLIERLIELAAAEPGLETVDITGGAPELHPDFRDLVRAMRSLGLSVIDRCNLTVLLEPEQVGLPEFLAGQGVTITASLPCYGRDNVDRQRGRGVFARSIDALCRLNRLGYGLPGSGLCLDLVYNPGGAFLPPSQHQLEAEYRAQLRALAGIEFTRLLTITNMPIKRFAHALTRDGEYHAYMHLLRDHFNPGTLEGLMCRSLVSVGHDGRLYDCDFNQMLELPLGGRGSTASVWDIERLSDVVGRRVATGPHCLGCTAGAGSSCGGALRGPAEGPGLEA